MRRCSSSRVDEFTVFISTAHSPSPCGAPCKGEGECSRPGRRQYSAVRGGTHREGSPAPFQHQRVSSSRFPYPLVQNRVYRSWSPVISNPCRSIDLHFLQGWCPGLALLNHHFHLREACDSGLAFCLAAFWLLKPAAPPCTKYRGFCAWRDWYTL